VTVIDSHCHIASLEHIPCSFIKGLLQNMAALLSARGASVSVARLWDLYSQKMQDPLCDELVAEMDAAGISKCVLMAADFTYALKDCPLTIEEALLKHREALLRHPGKLDAFAGMDPRWGKDGLTLFERALSEWGFTGFKLYPPCGFSPSDPALFPFYEICAQRGAPVVVHIGPSSPVFAFETARPFLVDEAARLFPGVNFILAHGAVSFTEECAMLCRFRPNVYLDTSAFQLALAWNPPASALKNVVSQGINHKILFGTDWPVFRLQGDQASFVSAFTTDDGPLSELSDGEKDLIWRRNIERLFEAAQPAAV
jgi:predicted TIM-barrel fold metal-dependent hydrolase